MENPGPYRMTVLCFGDIENLPHDGVDSGFELIKTSSVEEALELLVLGRFAVCLVDQGAADAELLVSNISETGASVPVYRVFRQARVLSGDFWIVDDETLPYVFGIVLKQIFQRQEEHRKFRLEKDALIQQMLALRDQQEHMDQNNIALSEKVKNLIYSTQKLEQRNAEKDKLFSIISHDLKSPFNAILGYTELLASKADTLSAQQVGKYAESAHTAALNVFRLMQNLLEWVRLQMDTVAYDPTFVNLHALIVATYDIYQGIAARKEINLVIEGHEQDVLYCDQGMIEVVLRNLVNNAIKFTHRGGRVQVKYSSLNNKVQQIQIIDNGQGMSEQHVRQLSDAANIRSHAGTHGETGTGLGLSICRDLVEKNKATMTIESRKYFGTTITLAFTDCP